MLVFFFQINALLEDLGLGQVKHTRVSDLTESEKRRLNVASQLLLDTGNYFFNLHETDFSNLNLSFISYASMFANLTIQIPKIHIGCHELFLLYLNLKSQSKLSAN